MQLKTDSSSMRHSTYTEMTRLTDRNTNTQTNTNPNPNKMTRLTKTQTKCCNN